MLLEEIAKGKLSRTPSRLIYDMSINKHYQQIGVPGSQATAFKHLNKLNIVVKTIIINHRREADPVIRFVEICMDNLDNPFLPKIYTAKLYSMDNDVRQSMIITMEELFPVAGTKSKLTDMTLPILKQLRIYPDQWDEEHPLYNLFDINDRSIGMIFDVVMEMFIDTKLRDWLKQNTPNRQLAKAIKLLDPLFDAHYPDMHQHNVMFRLTSVGPQLVLMDPIIG